MTLSPPPRIAWWAQRVDNNIASVRLRCSLIIEALRAKGMNAGFYRKQDPAPAVLILSKLYDEVSVAHALEVKRRHGTLILLDLCDNHFHNPKQLQKLAGRDAELRHAVASVDGVIVSTPKMGEIVAENCDSTPPIHVAGDALDDPLDLGPLFTFERLKAEIALGGLRRALARDGKVVRLVWFGNHGVSYAEGGMTDLGRIRPAIETLARKVPLTLTVISNNKKKFKAEISGWSIPTHYLRWHRATIGRALELHDISVIPVALNPFTIVKSNNRMVTSIAHGLAVAADPLPSYLPFAGVSVIGDWGPRFETLVTDAGARHHMAEAAKQFVATHYSTEVVAEDWAAAIRAALERATSAPDGIAGP